MLEVFNSFARRGAEAVGSPAAFLLALVLVAIWLATGPMFHYSDTWQLIINTGTTIVTFLMVFLIQATQNRDARAIHLKLDELICAVDNARVELVDAENLEDKELDRHQREFSKRREEAQTERQPDVRQPGA